MGFNEFVGLAKHLTASFCFRAGESDNMGWFYIIITPYPILCKALCPQQSGDGGFPTHTLSGPAAALR